MNTKHPYPSGPYTRGYDIGGGGGAGFIACRANEGKLIKTLGIYHNTNRCIRGLQILYTDDLKRVVIGSAAERYDELTFAPAEKIVRASLWGNGEGARPRTGHIRIETDKGQKLDVGKDISGLMKEYHAEVGSGLLAGFAGRAGGDIDTLSFIFILPIFSVTITDVEYRNSPAISSNAISERTVAHAHFSNPSNNATDLTFRNSITRTNTKTWSQAAAHTFGFKATVKANFFEIAYIGGRPQWSKTAMKVHETSSSEDLILEWALNVPLRPGESVMCSATCQQGVVNVDYDATVTVKVRGDSRLLSYKESGTLEIVEYALIKANKAPAVKVDGT